MCNFPPDFPVMCLIFKVNSNHIYSLFIYQHSRKNKVRKLEIKSVRRQIVDSLDNSLSFSLKKFSVCQVDQILISDSLCLGYV